tara:strand:+ start:8875 stop:9054 length:180 start_codon:yes stop_codon:yes gene_type:complete
MINELEQLMFTSEECAYLMGIQFTQEDRIEIRDFYCGILSETRKSEHESLLREVEYLMN